jgi:hypothetical protein
MLPEPGFGKQTTHEFWTAALPICVVNQNEVCYRYANCFAKNCKYCYAHGSADHLAF